MRWNRNNRGRRSLVALVAALAIVAVSCDYDPTDFAGTPQLSTCNGVPATIGLAWVAEDGPHGTSWRFRVN